MIRTILSSVSIAFWSLTSNPVMAASTLAYRVVQGGRTAMQVVNIQDGKIWISGVGGDSKTDVLFDRATQYGVLIDHRHQTYTPVNEEAIGKLCAQIEDMVPLVQGLGDQIRRLNPQQRAKWEKMLDGFPLDAFDQARQQMQSTHLHPKGRTQTIAGVRCDSMDLKAGHTADLELCIAQPDALSLTVEDADTLRAFIGFTQRVTRKAHGLASRFGLVAGQSDLDKLAGIPIQIREKKGAKPLSMTLNQAEKIKTPLKPLQIPATYRFQKFRFW